MCIALTFGFAAVVALETVFGTHIIPKLRRVADRPTATVLLLALGGLLLFSFIVTTFGAMAYLTFRLVQHLQAQGRFGIAEWAQETKQHFTSVSMKPEDNDDSDGSGVLVAHEANDKVKRENRSPSPSSRSLMASSGST
jgi:hypothetical protein